MVTKLINVQLSSNHLLFQPGKGTVSFEVSVTNLSEIFASFQMTLQAAGISQIDTIDWYKLEPDISSKTPPGGTAKFCVTLQKNPLPGFVGEMDILIRVFSVELANSEHRDFLHLTLEPGLETIPLTLKLLDKKLQGYPGQTLNIAAEIHQEGIRPINLIITLIGLNQDWLIEGETQRLLLSHKTSKKVNFVCKIPLSNEVISQIYPFIIKVVSEKNYTFETQGFLEVLPSGKVIFEVDPSSGTIPSKWKWLPHFKVFPAIYNLKFHNHSNLRQRMGASLVNSDSFPEKWQIINPQLPQVTLFIFTLFLNLWKADPVTACLFFREYFYVIVNPNETRELALKIQARRPWFGQVKTLFFTVSGTLIDLPKNNSSLPQIDLENSRQLVTLAVYPKISLWFGGFISLVLLWVYWWQSCFNPQSPFCGHQLSVNSVQFNGRGLSAVSGSDDQSIIEWNINGFGWENFFVHPIFYPIIRTGEPEENSQKAVRVVRYQPSENRLIAAGLENGEIEIWDLLNNRQCPQMRLTPNLANRVLDIAFSPYSQFFYSSYGSGQVLQWKYTPSLLDAETCNPPLTNLIKPVQERTFNFAIYSLLLVGENYNLLALGGQYNTLCLTQSNLTNNRCAIVGKRDGNEQDYLQSITTAEAQPYLLATADNQGQIKIWDLRQKNCLNNLPNCQDINPIDQWRHNNSLSSPIYSIALSEKGRYLVSGGQDGQVLLWILNSNGTRTCPEPIPIYKSKKSINSVDIIVIEQKIYILSGGDETKVRLDVKNLSKLKCINSANSNQEK
ncbi:WD-40 repeat protein [Gloeothece citriformis PCC 7424]|uniref:WD-40 repeat protein n=1 Tax=Gloeothece citriformis (strain PCC 7424) TaxID=65393 RepID=B7KC78_GLOC7|nr:hypothetical protein [Gloeothece citriformis]ACK70183.1 WD-40 repeat protein [Gloeothece citriformis PCC 7424]